MTESKSWTLEFQESFKHLDALYSFLEWNLPSELRDVAVTYPLFIPLRLAQKIKDQGPEGALAREFLPHTDELNTLFFTSGLKDPIGDKTFLKAPQLIHRYASRALFTPTSICPVHCRYCFRKNELSQSDELFQSDFEKTLVYLKQHPEISEIIFTGGDPLTLSNQKLKFYLEAFQKISSIKDIRFHTRYPMILPERLDEGFFNLLTQATQIFRTVSLGIHANHPDEFDSLVIEKLKTLSHTKIQLLSQTVLLKKVNDSEEILEKLMTLFMDLNIRPYYLHHPDRVHGGMHFYLGLEEGRRLYSSLRKKLPGWALPHYVVDLPGGEGKISAFNPESFSYSGQFLTQHGETIQIPEPDFFTPN